MTTQIDTVYSDRVRQYGFTSGVQDIELWNDAVPGFRRFQDSFGAGDTAETAHIFDCQIQDEQRPEEWEICRAWLKRTPSGFPPVLVRHEVLRSAVIGPTGPIGGITGFNNADKFRFSEGRKIISHVVSGDVLNSLVTNMNSISVGDPGNAAGVIYFPSSDFTSRTVESKLLDYLSVKDFGAAGDGNQDDTSAINRAIAYAADNYNQTIHFPNGIYRVTDTITVPQGIMLKGDGSQGSQDAHGTVIRHYSNNDCFYFDGQGSAASYGTGGGLENMLIVKMSGYTSGVALYLKAVLDGATLYRPGEMMITNVLIYGSGTGYWDRCIVIDGTAANVSGNRGVRTVNMRKVRVAEASVAGETVLLNQVSHFYSHGLAIDQGSATPAICGITLKGINNGVFFNAFNSVGSFNVIANDATNYTNHLHVDGKIQGSVNVLDDQTDGTFRVSGIATTVGASLTNKSKSLKFTSDFTPSVHVRRSSSSSETTGGASGPTITVPFNSEIVDVTGEFATDTFTCGVAGSYVVSYQITYTGLDSSHTSSEVSVVKTGYSNTVNVCNPYAISVGGLATVSGSCIVDMSYGDTLSITAKVVGSSETVNIYGASNQYTYLMIRYVA